MLGIAGRVSFGSPGSLGGVKLNDASRLRLSVNVIAMLGIAGRVSFGSPGSFGGVRLNEASRFRLRVIVIEMLGIAGRVSFGSPGRDTEGKLQDIKVSLLAL